MKTIIKLAHKVEGVGYDIAGGVARIKERMGPDTSPIKSEGSDSAPLVTRVPSPFTEHHNVAHLLTSMTRDNVFVPDAPMSMVAHPNTRGQAWWCGEEGCDMLCINVRDAKDLAVLDFETRSASA